MIRNPKNSFPRPGNVTAYASGQLVANSLVAGSVTPLQIRVGDAGSDGALIMNCRLTKSTTNVTSASFRVHVFGTSPTVANGDGGTFSPNNVAEFLGFYDINGMTATSDGAMGRSDDTPRIGVARQAMASVAEVFCLIEARGAYTPGNAETFGVILETLTGI